MWGRLDGAARLVELLLDPTRLREQPLTHVALAERLSRGMSDEDRAVVFEPVSHLHTSQALLDPGSAGAPSGDLRAWQNAWRLRLQLLILREELLTIQQAASRDYGANFAPGEADDLAKLTSESSIADVLDAFRGYSAGLRDIHKRVRSDLTSDAGTRLAATAAAVGVSATSSRTTGFPLPLTAALRTARGAAQTARFVVYRMTGSPIERGLFIIAMAIAALAFGLSVGTDLGPGNGHSTWKGLLLSASVIVLIVGFASLWRPKGRIGGARAGATLLAAGCSLAVVALAVALWSRPLTTSQSIAQRHTTIFLILMLVALSTLVGWLSTSRAALSGRQSLAILVVGVVILVAALLGGHRADDELHGSWLVDHLAAVLGGIAGVLLLTAWLMARRAENNW
jgi:hypothetical protein